MCGRIGQQLTNCDELGEKGEGGFEEVEEHDLSFGLWLMAYFLPKFYKDGEKKTTLVVVEIFFRPPLVRVGMTMLGKHRKLKLSSTKRKTRQFHQSK